MSVRTTVLSALRRLFRRTPPPAPPSDASLGASSTLLHTRSADVRRGSITHPNVVEPTPHLVRRAPFTAAELDRTVTDIVDAAADAGAVDDSALELADQWLRSILRGEYEIVEHHHEHQLHLWQQIHGEQRSHIVSTVARRSRYRADVLSADASYVHARDTLLGERATQPWVEEGLGGSSPLPAPTPVEPVRTLVHGVDFAFLAAGPSGIPVWESEGIVEVRLEGEAPAGAADLLQRVVAQLAPLTSVPLVCVPSPAPSRPREDHAIVVTYVDELDGDCAVGRGGPETQDGIVQRGRVRLLRSPVNEPGTPSAHHVLLHELLHALGLGHCAPGLDEVMCAEGMGRTDPGPGDRYALSLIRHTLVARPHAAKE